MVSGEGQKNAQETLRMQKRRKNCPVVSDDVESREIEMEGNSSEKNVEGKNQEQKGREGVTPKPQLQKFVPGREYVSFPSQYQKF